MSIPGNKFKSAPLRTTCGHQFNDLPERARQLADHGVTALQLVGWNQGGQDRGNPSHDPDDRLGTWDDLKTAISDD